MSMFSDEEALSRVSHELRTPLNAILGFGQLLALDQLSDSQRHSVEQIIAGGQHLLSLVEDLLDLSRAGASLELGPVDVRAALVEAATLCEPLAAEKSLLIDVEPGQGPLWAVADRRRLKQILLNLISNAIKYNRPSGSISLTAAAHGAERVRIEVSDTGIGMTEAQLGRLFEPFERLEARLHGIEGTGLGLAVSKALAEAMGGSIDVSSAPRAGSIFSLRLAAARAWQAEPFEATPRVRTAAAS